MDIPRLLGDPAEALAVGFRFWKAVGTDDDRAAIELLSETWPIRHTMSPAFCERYRDEREIRPEQCLLLNVYSGVDILAVDRVRFRYTMGPIGHHPAGEGLVVWRLELVYEGDAWRVAISTDRTPIATATLSVEGGASSGVLPTSRPN